jgi:hypothetical protein
VAGNASLVAYKPLASTRVATSELRHLLILVSFWLLTAHHQETAKK